ncbi:MAG: hypothetical protein VX447_12560 [Pseudomonadota bacterium]|uniref:hypothetical protein n=1 Tax=Gallaecimonas pentaromativorans TaxID=584787 RepID=UPI0012ECD4CE|nr:hypothetical protein [Gallaecimonas pentaromativorans]MED5525568.1 hypothetical protein [Pseudomonadota bacterium]
MQLTRPKLPNPGFHRRFKAAPVAVKVFYLPTEVSGQGRDVAPGLGHFDIDSHRRKGHRRRYPITAMGQTEMGLGVQGRPLCAATYLTWTHCPPQQPA